MSPIDPRQSSDLFDAAHEIGVAELLFAGGFIGEVAERAVHRFNAVHDAGVARLPMGEEYYRWGAELHGYRASARWLRGGRRVGGVPRRGRGAYRPTSS